MSALIDTQPRKLRAQLLGAMMRREAGEPPPQRLHFRRSVEPEEAAECGRVSFLEMLGPLDAEQRHEQERQQRRAQAIERRLPIRLSPTATSGSVRPCSWTFTSVAIFGSHNRSQSSSDFFRRRGLRRLPGEGSLERRVCLPPLSAEEYLPIIHLVFANLKTWLNGIHHGVSHQHLQAYLNEFTFRFNKRFYPFNAFRSLLGIAGDVTAPYLRRALLRSLAASYM